MKKVEEGQIIYWRFKGKEVFSQSIVLKVVDTDSGQLIEINDYIPFIAHFAPIRVLISEIDILTNKA